MNLLEKSYSGKKVLITGHTGFKGAWLTTWLYALGLMYMVSRVIFPLRLPCLKC